MNTSDLTYCIGARIAFNNYLANLVKIPGAGAQPNGRQIH